MIYLYLLLLSFVSFYIGCFFEYKKIFNKLRKGTGKLGLIKVTNDYKNIIGYIEIEELYQAGNMTNILILDTCVCTYYKDRYSKKVILEKGNISDWVETNTIIWYNDNSQRLRDSKLNEILNVK